MTEEVQQPVSTEQPASTAEPSLEQVYESFKVETPQAQPQQTAPAQPAQPFHVPDPALDPEGFRRYEATKAAESQAVQQTLQKTLGQLTEMQQAAHREREEADIKKAVAFLKEGVPEADDDMLEVYLGSKARKDNRLIQVWQNRGKNPQAWDAALKAIRNEAVGKFAVKTDPQLAENQRAMKTAQQAMATPQKQETIDEKLGKLKGQEWDRAWELLKQGQTPF